MYQTIPPCGFTYMPLMMERGRTIWLRLACENATFKLRRNARLDRRRVQGQAYLRVRGVPMLGADR